jgi:hypothetical protein
VSVFFFTPGLRQVLDENEVFLTEKRVGNIPLPTRALSEEV